MRLVNMMTGLEMRRGTSATGDLMARCPSPGKGVASGVYLVLSHLHTLCLDRHHGMRNPMTLRIVWVQPWVGQGIHFVMYEYYVWNQDVG
jgi:hypothetical protein